MKTKLSFGPAIGEASERVFKSGSQKGNYMKLILTFLTIFMLPVLVSAGESNRYYCIQENRQGYFSSEQSSGCKKVQLEEGWVNFMLIRPVIVDIKPESGISELDGKSIWVRFYLAEPVISADGRWEYDFIESLHKFYCGKGETRLIRGTYKLGGKTVYNRPEAEAITETVDSGTVNEDLYNFVCQMGMYYFGDAKVPDDMTDAEYDAYFKCPESYKTQAERDKAVQEFLKWAAESRPNWTLEQLIKYRVRLLKRHGCQETLKKINTKLQEKNRHKKGLIGNKSSAHADPDNISNAELSPRQIKIIQIVLNPDGYISKELHSEFWSLMPVELRTDRRAVDAMVYSIEKNFVYMMQLTREGWASMGASIEAGQVMKTPRYESIKKKVLALAPPQAKQRFKESIDTTERMIKAAAKRRPFQTNRGTIYITPEMVNQVLTGFQASSSRAHRLMNPEWNSEIKEYRYPEAHVAILFDSPFAVERKSLVAQNKKNLGVVMLTNQLDENTIVSITFTRHGSFLRDPGGAVQRNVKSVITGSGAIVTSLYSSQWRSRQSAQGDGTLKTSDGTYFFSVRSVELREQKGLLSIMAGSDTSSVEANLLRNQFEQSVQILK